MGSDKAYWLRPALGVAVIGWGATAFMPLIALYQQVGISAVATEAMFGLYAIGLVPGLLAGGWWSDRAGRRTVLLTGVVMSVLASVVLMAGAQWPALLFVGRLAAGVGSGLGFSAGAAWIREASRAHHDGHAGSRRATIAMTVGFGCGPLSAGLLGQWAPHPQVLPYVPHLIACLLAVPAVWRSEAPPAPVVHAAAGTDDGRSQRSLRAHLLLVVAPFAPWVFGAAAVAQAYLPPTVAATLGSHRLVFTAVATAVPAVSGLAVQPVMARLAAGRRATMLLAPALVVTIIGFATAIWAVSASSVTMVIVAAVVMGVAYGVTQYAGLADIQQVAGHHQLGVATSAYQALSYVGFALPYALALSTATLGWRPQYGLTAAMAAVAVCALWLTFLTRRQQ